jgi:hypothetical protein
MYLIGGLMGAWVAEASLDLAIEDEQFLQDWLGWEAPVPTPIPAPAPELRSRNSRPRKAKKKPAEDSPERFAAAYQVATGRVIHVLEECPAMRSSTSEVAASSFEQPLTLGEIADGLGQRICGTCLHMLDQGSMMVCTSESKNQILELHSDRLLLIEAPRWYRGEKIMEILPGFVESVSPHDGDYWNNPRILIYYGQAMSYPSGELLSTGHIVHELESFEHANQLADVVARTFDLRKKRD